MGALIFASGNAFHVGDHEFSRVLEIVIGNIRAQCSHDSWLKTSAIYNEKCKLTGHTGFCLDCYGKVKRDYN